MQWKKVFDRFIRRLVPLLLVTVFSTVCTYAADPGTILAKNVADENIVVYIQDPETDEIEAQIGTQICDKVSVSDGGLEPVYTLFLLDNSLSIAENYRPVIYELLTNILASRGTNEVFSIATYTDQINYIVQDASDFATLKKAVDSIQYDSHESHLTPVLYNYFETIAREKPEGLRRIIIVSDGASEEAIGYSFSELRDIIEDFPYPIYSIGVANSDNSNRDELENLFALSRLTKGGAWRINDISDTLEVASTIAGENAVKKITITPPETMCDGTEKGLLITAGSYSDRTTITMPFIRQQGEEASPVPDEEEPDASEKSSDESRGLPRMFEDLNFTIWIFAVSVVGVAVIVLVLMKKRKKKEQKSPEPVTGGAGGAVSFRQPADPDETGLARSASDDGDTAMVFNRRRTSPTLVLTDVNDSNRRYKAPLDNDILVGRRGDQGCRIVIPDQSVSKRHCIFTYKNGILYVSDAGSKNGTLVDGEDVTGSVRVEDGSKLLLGDVELRVEIKNA